MKFLFPDGISPGPVATEKGLVKENIAGKNTAPVLPPLLHKPEQAQNLPPLNHGIEMAGALPPLNHNTETASSLPPLNHAKEEASNLPPLLHGIEQAGNLPPLNHGNDALQSFNSLPPLHHGTEQAQNLPPLHHEIETNSFAPLSYANEQAGTLPPLLHGMEQAKNAPSLNDFEKESTQKVDALSAFTSQVNNALNNNGKLSHKQIHLDLNGIGKDSLVMPKYFNTRTGTSKAPQAGYNQSFMKGSDGMFRNYYNMQPVVQGKEIIDRQPFVANSENVDVPEINEEPLPESVESAQSKDSVPSAYDDKDEFQQLQTADRISQGVGTSPAGTKVKNRWSSGRMSL